MFVSIPLTRNQVALVDDADFAFLSQWRWRLNTKGYAIRSYWDGRRSVYLCMHRVLFCAERGQIVDHIDGNRLNNTRANLRLVTQGQNLMNRRLFKNSTSGFKGVSFNQGKWQVRIHLRGQRIHLGVFEDRVFAALVYDEAARCLYGDLARLNLPQERATPDVRWEVQRAFLLSDVA